MREPVTKPALIWFLFLSQNNSSFLHPIFTTCGQGCSNMYVHS
uniref:Uncharacterized protein n=1 Tax=Anguilla anguilla TaxID=7936 RepID=A0A0E9PX69_ANGAN